MITIEQPAMTLNAVANPPIARYQMWNSWDVASSETSEHIVGWSATVARGASAGKLKNLIIQCHGAPGYIGIGAGFTRSNVRLFRDLAGLVEKIWIVACQPAYIDQSSCGNASFCGSDGNLFISEIARHAQCYVVAPTETQINRAMSYPFGRIPSYEGLVLSYGPEGNVTWSHRYPSSWQGE